MPPARAVAPPADPRITFAYVGNPTDAAGRRQALVDNEVLTIGPDHVFAKALPDALDHETWKPYVGIPIYALHSIFLGGCIMDNTCFTQGMHFSITPERLTKFVKDLDASGEAWEPIAGEDIEAIPKAVAAFSAALRKLREDQRIITASDLFYDSTDPKNAETDTWFDKVTPQLLAAGGGGMDMVAQFGSVLPNWYTKDARDSEEFQSALAQILGSVGRDISSLPPIAQAAAIAQWLYRSRPPHDIFLYIPDPSLEIERRAGTDDQARYAPIFIRYWRTACPFLDKLWPHDVDDILVYTSGLMLSLDVASGAVTPQGMRALATEMKSLEAFATGSSNEERTAQVIRAHKTAGDDKEETADTKALLQADTGYQAFRTAVEAHRIDDHSGIALTAMEADHPAGLLFLNGLLRSDTLYKERGGARTDMVINAIFNKAVARNTKGELCDEWTNLIPDGIGKKLIGGKFAEIHYWNAFKAVVMKREGKAAMERVDKRLAKATNAEVFADPEAMRYLEKPVRAAMACIGFKSTDEHSFASFWHTFMRLSAAIENMPAACAPRKGLRKALLETAPKLLLCPQSRWECMLATPATAVKRIGDFVTAGHALNAANALDAHVARIMQEIDDGLHCFARDAANNVSDGGDATHKPEPKSGDGAGQKSESAWGSLATKFGIYASADGKRIAWGSCLTDFDTAPDLKANCPARFAPGGSIHSWCPTPGTCWDRWGDKAHDRLAEFPKEACKAASIGNLQPPLDWNTMTVTVVAPAPNRGGGGRNGNGKREREDDGQRQGRGKGKGAGKGKGKGGGRNGGKGGGRGFQRQPR